MAHLPAVRATSGRPRLPPAHLSRPVSLTSLQPLSRASSGSSRSDEDPGSSGSPASQGGQLPSKYEPLPAIPKRLVRQRTYEVIEPVVLKPGTPPVGPGAARSQSVDAGRPATAGERRDSEGSAQREGDADPSQKPQQGDAEDSSDSDDSDEDASDSEGDDDDLQSQRLEAAAREDAGTSSGIPQVGKRPRDQRADSVEEVAAGADGTDLPTDSLEVLPGQELETEDTPGVPRIGAPEKNYLKLNNYCTGEEEESASEEESGFTNTDGAA